MKQENDPIYLLASAPSMPELYRAAHSIGLNANGECHFIFSDRQRISNENVMLCPVKQGLSVAW